MSVRKSARSLCPVRHWASGALPSQDEDERVRQGIVAFGTGFITSVVTFRPCHLPLCTAHPFGQIDLLFTVGAVIWQLDIPVRRGRHNGMVIVIDIGLAASGDVFQAEVDRYIRDLRDTHDPVPGKDRIRLPGHIEEERTILHRREGIHFGEQEKRAMQALHEHYRVALPWD